MSERKKDALRSIIHAGIVLILLLLLFLIVRHKGCGIYEQRETLEWID